MESTQTFMSVMGLCDQMCTRHIAIATNVIKGITSICIYSSVQASLHGEAENNLLRNKKNNGN
jgi:hypothetical protein